MYGLGLVLMLVVIGGIIAFIGDRIGMKIGRKKLSVFGLRPKHTSMLITVITGIVVAGTSVLVMSIVSQDVRTALFRMHEIKATLASTQDQLSTAFAQLTTKEEELAKGEARVKELQGEIDGLTSEIDGLTTELEQVQEERAKAQKDKEALEEESKALETLIGDLTKEANELYEFIGLMREFLEGLQ